MLMAPTDNLASATLDKPGGAGSYLGALVLAACAVLSAVWLYANEIPMAFMDSGYPVWMAKQALLKRCDLGQDVFFGDSVLDSSIVPNRLAHPATNLGFAGGTPIDAYFFVKKALGCGLRPKRYVLSFGAGAYSIVQPWLWQNDVRYGAIGWKELRYVRSAASEIHDPSFEDTETDDNLRGAIRDFVYAVHFPSIYFNSLLAGRLFEREQANSVRFAYVERSRGYNSYGSSHNETGYIEPLNFRPLPLEKLFFERTIALVDQRGITVNFLITPVSARRATPESRHDLSAYLRYLHHVESEYPRFHLLQAKVPIWPDSMFVDGAHLNSKGARQFSNLVARCLRKTVPRSRASIARESCNFDFL